jgi:hypothetical protein
MFLNRPQVSGFDSGLMGATPSRRRRPSAPLFAMPGIRTKNRAGKIWEKLREKSCAVLWSKSLTLQCISWIMNRLWRVMKCTRGYERNKSLNSVVPARQANRSYTVPLGWSVLVWDTSIVDFWVWHALTQQGPPSWRGSWETVPAPTNLHECLKISGWNLARVEHICKKEERRPREMPWSSKPG